MISNVLKATMAATALILATTALSAQPIPEPQGKVILTITGNLGEPHASTGAKFDMAALQSLPKTEIRTSTIWTEGVQTFAGVALVDLLGTLGVVDGTLRAIAINEYSVEVPVTDAIEGGPIVAYHHNGEPMSIRDHGPLWLVYPYDSNPDYNSEVIHARSIWQLEEIEILP